MGYNSYADAFPVLGDPNMLWPATSNVDLVRFAVERVVEQMGEYMHRCYSIERMGVSDSEMVANVKRRG